MTMLDHLLIPAVAYRFSGIALLAVFAVVAVVAQRYLASVLSPIPPSELLAHPDRQGPAFYVGIVRGERAGAGRGWRVAGGAHPRRTVWPSYASPNRR